MNKKFLTLILGSMFLTLMALIIVATKDTKVAMGSVNVANEYSATTTDATWSTATTRCKDTFATTTSLGSKTLGSVIVTKTSNATLNIYDATTTGPHSDHATTTIASFPLTTVGTYIFDVTASRALCFVVDTTVGVASTTITTRK